MYRKPSRKHKSKNMTKPNLIPILDSVFIFIFFLLMSANFVKIFEISSDVPIISDQEPPKEKKDALNLSLKIYASSITLHSGNNERTIFKVGKDENGDYDLYKLREKLIQIKKSHSDEDTVIFMPKADIDYETLVKIMDTVRDLKDTDPEIWTKTKAGDDKKVTKLFNNIIFGDTQS
ncbi:biopolymer transporter ExbD [Bacteriovorax sp. Seq25_V]|uniref:ExbD/TolR family protein n=1 Tax=Bacteriovorax sp. Seq25_V TaxID=1201288 RepID=UPI000389E709|nr:biopolymer transporter ExbD [Bacteriovorax sp. Seq25_V]EQC44665.1 transport energizing protein, ExbD/TolR family [Bacteriovorax sp. Seq25_V]